MHCLMDEFNMKFAGTFDWIATQEKFQLGKDETVETKHGTSQNLLKCIFILLFYSKIRQDKFSLKSYLSWC